MSIRLIVAFLLLALLALGAGCKDEASMQRAEESLEQDATHAEHPASEQIPDPGARAVDEEATKAVKDLDR